MGWFGFCGFSKFLMMSFGFEILGWFGFRWWFYLYGANEVSRGRKVRRLEGRRSERESCERRQVSVEGVSVRLTCLAQKWNSVMLCECTLLLTYECDAFVVGTIF